MGDTTCCNFFPYCYLYSPPPPPSFSYVSRRYKHGGFKAKFFLFYIRVGIGKIRDDDEDGPNNYDFEDSFIDDESESEQEASDDSEWQPSGGEDDDDEDEDVKELLSEARNFTKNKKMLKPT